MKHFTERYLKTGYVPRTWPDYAALRDELAKLSHPARPDVNWQYAEKLCLAVFEQHGVELQTAGCLVHPDAYAVSRAVWAKRRFVSSGSADKPSVEYALAAAGIGSDGDPQWS